MTYIYLASQSPRRAQLLAQLGVRRGALSLEPLAQPVALALRDVGALAATPLPCPV